MYNGSKEKEEHFLSKPSVNALEFLAGSFPASNRDGYHLVTEMGTTYALVSVCVHLLGVKAIKFKSH